MILVDANILIYSANHASDMHAPAREWLDEMLNSGIRVGLPWVSLIAFLRITTNPRVFERPLTLSQSTRVLQAWLSVPSVTTPGPTERHSDVLMRLLEGGRATANLVTDAHLAALSLEHGLTLCSTDKDFARFPEIQWENPLSP